MTTRRQDRKNTRDRQEASAVSIEKYGKEMNGLGKAINARPVNAESISEGVPENGITSRLRNIGAAVLGRSRGIWQRRIDLLERNRQADELLNGAFTKRVDPVSGEELLSAKGLTIDGAPSNVTGLPTGLMARSLVSATTSTSATKAPSAPEPWRVDVPGGLYTVGGSHDLVADTEIAPEFPMEVRQ